MIRKSAESAIATFLAMEEDRNPLILSEMNMVLAAGDFEEAHRKRSQALATQTAFHRKTRSCAIDYLEVVEGKIDLLAYRRTRPWDHAPGVFLVQQSGGLAERYNGSAYQPFDESEGIVVCRNREFQNEMRQFTPNFFT